MAEFQRARSEEQREERRRAILAVADEMLSEMPVSAIALNALSRRLGLAKSNVLRYFDSREAILLTLLTGRAVQFGSDVAAGLRQAAWRGGTVESRAQAVAETLATAFAADPKLCELLSAQSAVLEQNISDAVAVAFKQQARIALDGLAGLLGEVVPELDERACRWVAITVVLHVSSLWRHCNPSGPVAAAYEADPALDLLPGQFAEVAERAFATVILGAIARPGSRAG